MMSRIKAEPAIRFERLSDAYGWLDSHINYEQVLNKTAYSKSTFDLESFRALISRLGNPQKGISSIHIAGSRGKGSTTLILEALLRASGLSEATYTSPHLREYRERIRINGEPLEGGLFCRALEEAARVREPAPEEHDPTAFKTVFEYLTAVYFLAARRAGVDWMVVETGLGGRLDATNVLDAGPVVLTRIGLEHTHLLGSTIPLIAAEKAAILKPGGWGVVCQQLEGGGAAEVFQARSAETGAPLADASRLCPILAQAFDTHGMKLQLRFEGEAIDLRLPFYGPFLIENIQGALAAFAELRSRGSIPARPPRQVISDAFTSLCLPGRMEPLRKDAHGVPTLLVDSAHCPTGAAAVAAAMETHFGNSPAIAVVGMMMDKDHEAFFKSLAGWPGWNRIICYTAATARAEPADSLAARARGFFSAVDACPDLNSALESAAIHAEKGPRVVALGSIYSVAWAQDWSRQDGRKACCPDKSSAEANQEPGPGDSGAQRQAVPR